jgi:mannose-1-phosphate guanylyltransferase
VVARDPTARVLFLPSDHFVADESRLFVAMLAAVRATGTAPDKLQLLGIEPDEADADLGYIIPGDPTDGAQRVMRFVEKPAAADAAALIGAGALWNSFIFAATARTLLALLRTRAPAVVQAMTAATASGQATDMARLYTVLPQLDFSSHVLTGSERQLRVVAVRGCGWTDLGTPRRVGAVIARASKASLCMERRPQTDAATVSLVTAYRCLNSPTVHAGRRQQISIATLAGDA